MSLNNKISAICTLNEKRMDGYVCCTVQWRKLSWNDINGANLFNKTTDSECYVWV